MYEYIEGAVAELGPAYVVIDAGGVGYYINISLQTYTELEKRERAKVFVHFIVREDAQILYGFATRDERGLFRMLIGVSGVGGNTARMILSTYSPTELKNIIASENAALLKNVKGLGLKTAQKIIVELKDKMITVGIDAKSISSADVSSQSMEIYEEAVSALSMLGFSKAASEKAVRAVVKEKPDASVEDVVRLSLKKL